MFVLKMGPVLPTKYRVRLVIATTTKIDLGALTRFKPRKNEKRFFDMLYVLHAVRPSSLYV